MPELSIIQIELFILVFIRIGAFLFLMPLFSSVSVPVQYRVGLAFYLTVLLFPQIESVATIEAVSNLPQLGAMVLKELVLAVMIGFLFNALFAAVAYAGAIVDLQMGFAMLQIPDPIMEGEMTSATGMFQTIFFTIIFLMFDGHYYLFVAIEKSFDLIPPGNILVKAGDLVSVIVLTLSHIMEIAIRIAAPLLIVMVVTSVTLGVIAKTMPQMNIFFVGMPLKIAVGFLSLIFVLPMLVQIFKSTFLKLYEDIWSLMQRMAV